MLLLASFYLIALVLSFFVFFEDKKDIYTRGFFVAAALVLCLFAALRPIGADADSRTYAYLYENVRAEFIELSFVWIVQLVHVLFEDVRWLFVIYALLAIPVHIYGVFRLSPYILLSLLLWFAHYFLIQDYTQIRVAVSIGLWFVGLVYLGANKRLKYFFFVLLAIFFHYSAVAYLLPLFFSNKPLTLKGRFFLGGIIVFVYALYFAHIDLIVSLPIPYMQNKLDDYERMRDMGIMGDEINVFNVIFLFRVLLFFYFLLKYSRLVRHYPNATLLLKVYCCSLASYVGLASLPIVAGRICELYGVVEIILFPMLLKTIRPFAFGRLLLVIFALGLLSLNLWYNQLINFI